MSKPVIFYSWQSDLPRARTRDIIHVAAESAVVRLSQQLRLEDAPRFDHDTLDEAGAPAICETIFRKIRDSAMLIADVSFVSKSDELEGKKNKKLPNPNVMLELGYAAATIGWERVILVMNDHYGGAEHLPFDLKHRRFPITFTMPPLSERPAPTEELSANVEGALRDGFAREHGRVEVTISKLSTYARKMMTEFGPHLQFWESEDKNVVLSRMDLAISQMLEAGVISCVSAASVSGLAYEWTYLGRQCITRLGANVLAPTAISSPPVDMIVNTPFYDAIGESV